MIDDSTPVPGAALEQAERMARFRQWADDLPDGKREVFHLVHEPEMSIRSRGRRHLPLLIGPLGPITDAEGNPVVARHSRVEGLTPAELYASAAGARKGLAQYWKRWERISQEMRQQDQPEPFTVLARARRAGHAGIVLARAADNGEVDPLVDADSRLLVGLAVPQDLSGLTRQA